MIQLMTFLISQLMFVPVYLKVTDTCTENKGTFWQKIKIISISPFAVYLLICASKTRDFSREIRMRLENVI